MFCTEMKIALPIISGNKKQKSQIGVYCVLQRYVHSEAIKQCNGHGRESGLKHKM